MEMSTCFSVLTDYSKHISVANLLRRLSVLLFGVFLSFVSVNTLRGRFFFLSTLINCHMKSGSIRLKHGRNLIIWRFRSRIKYIFFLSICLARVR